MTMRCRHPKVGVCVIRIEAQRSGTLITLQENDDIEQISTARTSVKADIDTAVAAVREFLRSFTDSAGCAEGREPGQPDSA